MGLREYRGPRIDEVNFRLANPAQEKDFIHTLFSNRIPHASYTGDVLTTSYEVKSALEEMGFELEAVNLIKLGELSLEERNAIKKRSREYWFATRDSVIDEFLAKYGTE